MTPTTTLLATELRDGLLQDLVAIDMMVSHLRQTLDPDAAPEADRLLACAHDTLASDLGALRSVITRLGPPA